MSTPESPLNPETLDELLSAEIDGELERAATDLGLTLDEAVAAMEAAPGLPVRRAELTRARDTLAAPIPLAPSAELQLVSAALRRSVDEVRAARERPRRAWKVLVAVGSAAAIVAGVVALAATHPGTESDSKSATALAVPSAAGGTEAPPLASVKTTRSVAFGAISRPEFRAELAARLNTPAAAPTPLTGGVGGVGGSGAIGATGPTGPTGPTAPISPGGNFGASGSGTQKAAGVAGIIDGQFSVGLAGPQGLQGDEGIAAPLGAIGPLGPSGITGAGALALAGPQGVTGAQGRPVAPRKTVDHAAPRAGARGAAGNPAAFAGSAAADREHACSAAIKRRAHLTEVPALFGTGTYTGRPVVVVVFPRPQTYVAYVMSASDCTVLLEQTLP